MLFIAIMSLKVGLGHSENDLEIQGEIDFDFFDSRPRDNEENEPAQGLKNPAQRSFENEQLQHEPQITIDPPQPSTSQGASKRESNFKEKSVDKLSRQRSEHNVQEESVTCKINSESQMKHAKHTRKVIKTNVVIPRLEGEHELGQTINLTSLPEQQTLSNDSIFMEVAKADDASSSEDTSSQSSSISMSDSDGGSSLSDESFESLTDSESITDVTPLNSPYFCDSPRPQSTCSRLIDRPKLKSRTLLNKSPDKEMDYYDDNNASNSESLARRKKDIVRFEDEIQPNPTSSDQTDGSIDLNVLVAAIQKLEVQQNRYLNLSKSRNCSTPPVGAQSRPLLQRAPCTTSKSRKNMSFSNDEVRRIDQENQRLLKKIVTQQSRQKSKTALGLNGTLPMRGLYTPSSQVNRRRRHRQIEIENVAILKRIEAAKPSTELTRSHLLRDYNRLANGSPSFSPSSRPSSSNQTLSTRNPVRHFSRSYSLSSLPTSSEIRPATANLLRGRKKLDSAPVGMLDRQRNSQ